MTAKLIVAAAFVGLAATASAQETVRVAVAPDSKLWIDGTSNLHSWSCKTEKFEASIEFDKASANDLATKALRKVDVKVPVKSLKCNHAGMDGNVYKALKADQSPEINYILGTFEAVPGTADSFDLKTVGKLMIAGAEKELNMEVSATRLPDGSIKATGVVPILMTDYGIKPPTAILGRLKTGNEVKVNFELTVLPKAMAAALGGER